MIKAVIGANYGDEGKGLMVDYFAAIDPSNTIVVRFNGGAQAGHTVVTPDRFRHVFSHFGSGTVAGARTLLSEKFIINPILFRREYEILKSKGVDMDNLMPFISHNCRVALPFDMMMNQIIERKRGDKRHGSCGLGIFETVYRSRFGQFKLTYQSLATISRAELKKAINLYLERYLGHRLLNYGLKESDWDMSQFGDINKIIDRYIEDCDFMINHSLLDCAKNTLPQFQNIIFEGAQGLALHQKYRTFTPHLTPSNTGLENVKNTMKNLGMLQSTGAFPEDFEVIYVTRTYLTRHGAGELPGECSQEKLFRQSVLDETNKNNEFQGQLRYAPLDAKSMYYSRILDDAGISYKGKLSLAVTHVNELPADHWLDEVIKDIEKSNKGDIYLSYGKTRADIDRISEHEAG